jgi:phosphoribosylformylglycinamidine cyclo-ligase
MHHVFNCGIGMVLAVAPKDVDATIAHLNAAGETAYAIGEVVTRERGAPHAVVV